MRYCFFILLFFSVACFAQPDSKERYEKEQLFFSHIILSAVIDNLEDNDKLKELRPEDVILNKGRTGVLYKLLVKYDKDTITLCINGKRPVEFILHMKDRKIFKLEKCVENHKITYTRVNRAKIEPENVNSKHKQFSLDIFEEAYLNDSNWLLGSQQISLEILAVSQFEDRTHAMIRLGDTGTVRTFTYHDDILYDMVDIHLVPQIRKIIFAIHMYSNWDTLYLGDLYVTDLHKNGYYCERIQSMHNSAR